MWQAVGILVLVGWLAVGCEHGLTATVPDAAFDDAGDRGDAMIEDDAGEPAKSDGWHQLSRARAGEYVHLSDDGHEFERTAISAESAGSTHGVKAYEGVFYFEMESLVELPRQRFGVGPADMELAGDVGDHPMSLGVTETGDVFVAGTRIATYPSGASAFGFVVDRRDAAPVVHVVVGTPTHPRGVVVATHRLESLTGPVHAYVSGPRVALGYQARFNAGYDTVNAPFAYDARAALRAADPDAASELVLGWGRSESSPWNVPPSVSIHGASRISPGEPLALTLSAQDAEDGDLATRLIIEDDALPHSVREVKLEPGGYYRSAIVGRHRLRASVVDSGGKRTDAIHVVDVQGTPPILSAVRLFNTPGDGAVLTSDGRGVRFTQATKDGVRANQGLLDGYWYFEVSHVGPYGNFGAGLVVQEGSIVPYGLRAVAASCSMNFISGIWHDIIWFAPQPPGGPHQTVGFAVDYRRSMPGGRDYPIVHVIVAGVLAASIPMTDATTPVHPMLYGTVTSGTGPQLVANFGDRSFVYDARAALTTAGHPDASQLRLGWGVHAR
jgi:hypothetical protein